ncbi:GNAT family N-acetyltransferase [Tepidimicrobium xylanilyticum]|uniref:Ribosomal protein S18 acetylase RimI n=1 Tax=Tepidimicrobium xylanilyticum TaxID=1123352 RepID=A0A1H3AR13_9FIRM|nr:GNAT family N-acetyltransferase [Tepidimicrobium xylanilyticum]SDX31289.1 Ribosomal protein S18 acetylase RimI [Tepidimicrobium xylanilyticum]
MEFRKAIESDIDNIMNIIKQAQDYFKEQGIDQWQNNYPNPEVVREDIDRGYGYVLLKKGEIVGTVAVSFDGEKTYEKIYDGQWISNFDYAVIHRLAIDSNYKGQGLASIIVKNIEKMCLRENIKSIRIDTHEDNESMQRLIQKNGFKYCGIIHLRDNSKRLAFEKII